MKTKLLKKQKRKTPIQIFIKFPSKTLFQLKNPSKPPQKQPFTIKSTKIQPHF